MLFPKCTRAYRFTLVTSDLISLADVCLMFDLRTYTEKMPDTARYRYHRGDYDGINQELNSIDWDSQLADKNTEES